MRLKASYTVEASYIVPLFTIILTVFIQLMLFLHDRAVCGSVMVKINMQEEFLGVNYEEEAKEYLKNRLILDGVSIEPGNVSIRSNNMTEYVRISKALHEGGE